jgi:hypothetical protein
MTDPTNLRATYTYEYLFVDLPFNAIGQTMLKPYIDAGWRVIDSSILPSTKSQSPDPDYAPAHAYFLLERIVYQ